MVAITYDTDLGPLFSYYSDFVYYCHFVHHTKDTLTNMDEALKLFKTEVEEQLFEHSNTFFKTSKYHLLEHYTMMIKRFGSLLNGDTETTEGMHPAVKAAYRNTNKKGN